MRLGVHAEESEFYYKCDEKTREGSEQSGITIFYLFLKAGYGLLEGEAGSRKLGGSAAARREAIAS